MPACSRNEQRLPCDTQPLSVLEGRKEMGDLNLNQQVLNVANVLLGRKHVSSTTLFIGKGTASVVCVVCRCSLWEAECVSLI